MKDAIRRVCFPKHFVGLLPLDGLPGRIKAIGMDDATHPQVGLAYLLVSCCNRYTQNSIEVYIHDAFISVHQPAVLHFRPRHGVHAAKLTDDTLLDRLRIVYSFVS